jgi:cytochrome c oxidase subunit 3
MIEQILKVAKALRVSLEEIFKRGTNRIKTCLEYYCNFKKEETPKGEESITKSNIECKKEEDSQAQKILSPEELRIRRKELEDTLEAYILKSQKMLLKYEVDKNGDVVWIKPEKKRIPEVVVERTSPLGIGVPVSIPLDHGPCMVCLDDPTKCKCKCYCSLPTPRSPIKFPSKEVNLDLTISDYLNCKCPKCYMRKAISTIYTYGDDHNSNKQYIDLPKQLKKETPFLYIKTKHSFHLVDPSPWPIAISFGVLMLTTGFVLYMHKFSGAKPLSFTGLALVSFVLFTWWRDIIREATFEEQHSYVVQRGLRLAVILFIVSEIMFFFAFFWAFFHSSLSPTFNIGGVWPPLSIIPIKTLGIPLTNTFFLLTSGATVTWSHHALLLRAKKHSLIGLILTLVLAFLFTCFQVLEYFDAPFNISDSIFGSCFYLTTGFHGFHVLAGTAALYVSFVRLVLNHYTNTLHFGFESSIWYWHFVDVVWICLFAIVYWWGGKI